MKKIASLIRNWRYIIVFLYLVLPHEAYGCSTFKLQKGKSLVYGHNLNEGDMGVPGLVFVNKRGVFKMGRSWSELTTLEKNNASSHCWISRYGSVTFNNFGRDFPDGGMNEVGLYIWEMNDDADYPKDENLPKLNQMNWMQYILDNFSTVEEAIQCASEIEIDGWGWHFFAGDAHGNTAAIAFIDGEVVVHTGENMPVPALFNTPYKRELELLRYYEGFGGLYEPDLKDPKVPRFVKTAVMIRDYKSEENIVDYGFEMLKKIMVDDEPEWSILFDVHERNVYFKTRINPEIKSFSMDDLDFSNESAVLILNMDIQKGGDIFDLLNPYSNEKMSEFTETLIFPLIPEEFFTHGGISKEEYLHRTSTHSDAASLPKNQIFSGVWRNVPDTLKKEPQLTLKLETNGDAVHGYFSNDEEKDFIQVDHLHLIGNNLNLTYKTSSNTLIEIKADIKGEKMDIRVLGIENDYGNFQLFKSME